MSKKVKKKKPEMQIASLPDETRLLLFSIGA
jgi:hypothetical protein